MLLRQLGFELYGALPVALQNTAISAWGYRTKAVRYGREFWRRLEWLERSQWWSSSEIEEYQTVSLSEILRHARDTIPFYRERFERSGVTRLSAFSREELRRLPILTKAELLSAGKDAILSSAFRKRSLHLSRTSGTTGSPFIVWLTPEALQFQWAVWWRHKARFGLKPGDRYLTFGARLPMPGNQRTPPFWRHNSAFNQTYLSTYHLTPKHMPVVLDWLRRESFSFFTGYPSAMFVLATFMLDHGVTLSEPPRQVVSGSDALLPAFESTISKAFGASVTDQYGSAEACGNFARCEKGRYHLDAEFGLVELLPIDGVNHPRLRRIVFTGFGNRAMPFIRYDTGDVGLLSDDPCTCGRATVSLDHIDGRTEDYVRTPDGRMVIGLNQAFEWAPGILATQVVQDRLEDIRVLVVPGNGFRKSDLSVLEFELRQRLGHEIQIKFEVVDQIPLTAAGKFRAVISRIPVAREAELSQRRMIEHGLNG